MNKKRLFSYLIVAAVFATSLVVKVQIIKDKASEEKVTISSIWAKEGRPVYSAKIKKEGMPLYTKITTKITGKRTMTGYLPANLVSQVRINQVFDVEIEGHEYSVIVRSIGNVSGNYSGFVAVKSRSTKDLHKDVGSLVISRVPYNGNKKTLTVPLDAIYFDGMDNNLYVIVDNKVQIRKIKVTAKNHKKAVVSGNIKEGDTIIVSDQRDLAEGEFVASVAK